MEERFERQGLIDWFVVTKLLLLDAGLGPIGITVVLRHAAEHALSMRAALQYNANAELV